MLLSISEDDLSRLVSIIREVTGNNVQEKNFPMVRSRITARLAKLGIASIEAYWTHYAINREDERQALQSLMTTHYTFFFREYAHFEALEAWIEENALRLKKRVAETNRPLKVWSAACSRGQEVYSLAMFLEFKLLKRHGIPYKILGTDIDKDSVEFARNGVYPLKEVNTIPQQYLSGYWKRGTGSIKDYAAAHPRLRENTEFDTLNLLEIGRAAEKFDIIFVRNVFIYFTEDNVKKIALDLKENLADYGFFASGISEPLRFAEWDLVSSSPSCYVKIPPSSAKSLSESALSVTAVTTAPSAPSAPSAPTAKDPSYKVLCVDDSQTIQALMRNIFAQDPNCSGVVSALNGVEARQRLDAEKFALITLDIHMPVMGGIEFLETAYKRQQDPPVLMISSVNRTDVDLATKAISLGAFDYIEKPAMNTLQKSADEILTKAKMALRSHALPASRAETDDYTQAVGEKIVVPDASQCVRWVKTDKASAPLLESIVTMQLRELRSPPLVISAPQSDLAEIERLVVDWSSRNLERLHAAKSFLRPNWLYLCDAALAKEVSAGLQAKRVSLQILCAPHEDLSFFSRFQNIQVLLDESLAGSGDAAIRRQGLSLSDVTPATSFTSLSLEYFANIRKAQAA